MILGKNRDKSLFCSKISSRFIHSETQNPNNINKAKCKELATSHSPVTPLPLNLNYAHFCFLHFGIKGFLSVLEPISTLVAQSISTEFFLSLKMPFCQISKLLVPSLPQEFIQCHLLTIASISPFIFKMRPTNFHLFMLYFVSWYLSLFDVIYT